MTKTLIERVIVAVYEANSYGSSLSDDEAEAAIRAVLQEMVNSDNILYDKLCEYGGRVEYVCGTCKERDRQYGRPVYSYGDEIGAELAESVFRSMVQQFAKENGIEL